MLLALYPALAVDSLPCVTFWTTLWNFPVSLNDSRTNLTWVWSLDLDWLYLVCHKPGRPLVAGPGTHPTWEEDGGQSLRVQGKLFHFRGPHGVTSASLNGTGNDYSVTSCFKNKRTPVLNIYVALPSFGGKFP